MVRLSSAVQAHIPEGPSDHSLTHAGRITYVFELWFPPILHGNNNPCLKFVVKIK